MPFHIFDIELVKEYFGTCKEYLGFMVKPFTDVPLISLWKCNQSDWEKAFKEWSLMNFYVGVVVHIVANFIYALAWGIGDYIVHALITICYNIFFTYFFSHMGWFGVVKKGGFCWFCCCCISDAPILNLVWGIWMCFYGCMMILTAVSWLSYVGEYILLLPGAILYIVYSIVWIYMGVCCIQIWIAKGSQIVPANMEIKGPDAVVPGKPGSEELC